MRTRKFTLATAGWLVATALVAVVMMTDGGADGVLLADADSLADAPDTAAIHRITPHDNFGNDGTTAAPIFRQTIRHRKLLGAYDADIQGDMVDSYSRFSDNGALYALLRVRVLRSILYLMYCSILYLSVFCDLKLDKII